MTMARTPAAIADQAGGEAACAPRPSERAARSNRNGMAMLPRDRASAAIQIGRTVCGVASVCNGGPADEEREHQRNRAVCADAAVAHDLELAVAVASSAKAIAEIREAVFVKCAGCQNADRERQSCSDRRWQSGDNA